MSIVHKALKRAENDEQRKARISSGIPFEMASAEKPSTQRIVVILAIFFALLLFSVYFPNYYRAKALKEAKESISITPPGTVPSAKEPVTAKEPVIAVGIDEITASDLEGSAESLNKKGIYFYSLGDYDSALVFFSAAVKKDRRNHELYNNLGLTQKMLHKYKDALKNYQYALSLNDDYKEGHNNIGVLYDELGRRKRAIDSFKRAIELDENYPDPHLNAAITYEKMQKYKHALKFYEKYLARAKRDRTGLTKKHLGALDEIKKKMEILRKL